MLDFIDDFLNQITMYRLLLYFLYFLLGAAVIFSFLHILPYDPSMLILSAGILLVVSLVANKIFAYVWNIPANVESAYITALILALIISPPTALSDQAGLWFLFWAAVVAMASKYILAIERKHIFNPAAFAAALMPFTINQSASWWVGTASMMPLVLLGGLLITRKLRRADLVIAFIVVSILGSLYFHGSSVESVMVILQKTILYSPLLFFAFVMLTEPLTTPPSRPGRIMYGALIGAIFDPAAQLFGVYSTPELALCVGNIFSYLISPKKKLMLRLKDRKKIASGVYDFTFESPERFHFRPGQYLEWTLGHRPSDSRGNRRYFTIASSPGHTDVHVGVKFYENGSSYKEALGSLDRGDTILAGQLAGDFVLPRNKTKKLCLIAGGIGVTPFQSMVQYLLEKKERRDAVVLYSNKSIDDIAYAETLEQARREIGLNTVYTLTDKNIPADWRGERGYISPGMVKRHMPDYQERIFYISGPQAMVTAVENMLRDMGVRKSHIKTDFFPGFA